jgi:UDP-N-acetylmuramoylalanine--D-glutamate ligase
MKIAIAGFGIEGKSSYNYFLEKGNDVAILDERTAIEGLPVGAKCLLGTDAFKNLNEYDMVIRTPSLPPEKLANAKKTWSATNEFFAHCPAPIIGVTGTKGKGTTCSLVAAILRKTGRTVHLVGNIGTPALDVIKDISQDDIVVYELSSFQLWDLERSPHVAVVLLIEPDHLNVHVDFDEYVAAKANISAHQKPDDVIIYHPTNEASARIATLSSARVKRRFLTPEAAYVSGSQIVIDDTQICDVNEVGLLGDYNLQNVCAAISACWQFTQDRAAIAEAVQAFKGLEHRLEFVAEKNGVVFYNDSFSSAPTATMAAITVFTQPIILIVGGYDRGIDFTPLATSIAMTPYVKRALLVGQTRERLADALQLQGFDRFSVLSTQSMKEIVAYARNEASTGDVVLLSPGCASFDMFTNFADRGHQFKIAVKDLHE